MKTTSLTSRLLAVVAAAAAFSLFSIPAAWAAQDPLVGFWLAKIDGEHETRSLIIKEAAPTGDGVLLSARYGMSSQGTGPVEAKAIQNGNQRQFVLVTQAGSKIVATEESDGRLVGTFVLKNGTTKGVVITRSTEDELQSLVAQGKPATKPVALIQPPGPSVPANCAGFSGGWGGEWPIVGYASLWVISIDTNCTAKFIYPAGPRQPKSADGAKEGTIKGNTLEIRRPDGGVTTFDLRDGAISAFYRGGNGSTNSVTLRRIDADSTAQARVEAEQKAAMASIPPGPDVPADCAGYYGNWGGNWSQGQQGEWYLRVAEVRSSGDGCVVRYSYAPSKGHVPAKETAEIKRGSITFVCNRSTGGTCIFTRQGDVLTASYTNPGGGSNNGTFKRVE